jgi:hypothetical protein
MYDACKEARAAGELFNCFFSFLFSHRHNNSKPPTER